VLPSATATRCYNHGKNSTREKQKQKFTNT